MKASPLWACSAIAFQVSLRERVPAFVQDASLRLGVASFWAALAIEGRARQAWKDLQALQAGAGDAGHRAASMVEDLKDLLLQCDGSCVATPAWSLPDSDRMRGLGLGRVWAVHCPFCEGYHVHSPGEETRTPHCRAETSDERYLLVYAGALPHEHHDGFCRSAKTGLPKFLLSGPVASSAPEPEVQPLAA